MIHAQQADRQGNVLMWGITGVQKEAVLCAKQSLVTVEEIVDGPLDRAKPGAVFLPHWTVDYVSLAPCGAFPAYAQGYYDRSNAFYRKWDVISQDRTNFLVWLDRYVLSCASWGETWSKMKEDGIA